MLDKLKETVVLKTTSICSAILSEHHWLVTDNREIDWFKLSRPLGTIYAIMEMLLPANLYGWYY